MAIERLADGDAAELFDEILSALRRHEHEDVARLITEIANTRVIEEIAASDLAHLPRAVRSELSTKSVRPRTASEKLEVALKVLDSRLREAPAVAAAAARELGTLPENIVFVPDETAVEGMPEAPRDESFNLRDLAEGSDTSEAVNLLDTLWSAVGRSVPTREPSRAES